MRFLLLIPLLLSCNCSNNTSTTSKVDSLTSPIILAQNKPIDTASIIKEIKKKYSYMIKRKRFAKITTDEHHAENIDTSKFEYSGDFYISNDCDTTFEINDSLVLEIHSRKGEDQFGDTYTRTERYYKNNELFFDFDQEIREAGLHNSYIKETRTYYDRKEFIKCLYRELFTDDYSIMTDSINKIGFKNCTGS